MRTGIADIATQLRAAAVDGDPNRIRQLLADLLPCGMHCTDEDPCADEDSCADEHPCSPLRALGDLLLLLHSMALTDELTGVRNRRGFLRSGAELLEMASRMQQGAVLLYIDVDQLKYVNDSSGHDAGDALLRRTAQVLREVAGNHGVIGRLGGDEFAVLDAAVKGGGRNQLLRRVEDALADHNASAAVPPLSLSIGCAEFDPRKPVSMMTLLALADRAMYRRKTMYRRKARTLGHVGRALTVP